MLSLASIIYHFKSYLYKFVDFYFQKKYTHDFIQKNNINEVIINNRSILSSINKWIENDVYENSLFNYGLPFKVKHLIDKPINNQIIYSDILAFLSLKLDQVNYLELGVSVGKNFFLMANYLSNSALTGFDIENINPILEKQFKHKKQIVKWNTFSSIKKDQSSLDYYSYNSNKVQYLCGDIFDENSWTKLKGQKFNMIFSDAFHSPQGLAFEYKMLKKYDLIDKNNFVYFFDDLGGCMTIQFLKIFNDMKIKYQVNKDNIALNYYNGWLGQHEHRHLNGIIFKFL